ncbi:MAG: glycosyltransferase family 4 protein [Calditrichaeota bacterium]|nr:glycosyltransferase family 4 protein [Calditrichota bacterium]MCB9369109.1 glycosyltransferase family 4 protein [Calditrichota bacterium]
MKVLHVMNGPNWGGSYRFVSQLCERQRAQGVDAVVCYLEGGPSKDRVVQLGAPVLAYDPDRTYSSKRERWADLEKGYEKIVTEWQPDLINSHLSLSHLLTNRLYRRKLTPKWVALIHQSWKQYGFSHDVMKKPWKKHYLMMRHGLGDAWMTRKANRITTVSEAVRQDCLKVGMGKHRVTNVYSGIILADPNTQPDLRAEWGIPKDHRVIAGLGYFDPRKGFDLLIQAFLLFADRFPDVHVVVAGGDLWGDTQFRQMLFKLRDGSKHANRIHILREQKSGDAFMYNADICAIPSIEEAFSLVVVEAMQFGKPSVVTSAGGCKDVCRDGQESLVFQSCNIPDLAAKLERLLSNPDLASRLGNAAATRAKTEFTLDRCARDHISIYKEVLAEKA